MQLASAAAQRRAPVPLSVGTAQRATTCAAPGAPALRSGPRLSRLRASALMPQHNPWVTAHAAPRPAAAPRAPPPVAAPARQPTPHRRAPRRAVAAAAAAPLPSNPDACTAALAPRLRAAAAAAAAGIDQHFLPFCLTAGVVAGCLYPPAGVAAAKLNLSTLVTFAMFVIAGLQLRGEEAAKALQARGALLYGLVSILLVTPLISLAVLQLPLQPRELALGLAIFCCMPTALSSGITFTQAVGGNVAVALLLTVASNLLGVFTMPLMLPALLGDSLGGAALEPAPLLARLVACVLVPTILGALVRARVKGAAALIDARKRPLARASAVLLGLVPWTQVSKTVAAGVSVPPGSLALALAAGIGVHFAFLALNTAACRLFRLGDFAGPSGALGIRRAVVLTASVKTLPVAIAVFAALAPVLGGMLGVAMVPAMMAHLAQILIDSAIVSRWQGQARAEAAAAAAAAEAAAAAAAAVVAAAAPEDSRRRKQGVEATAAAEAEGQEWGVAAVPTAAAA